MSRQYVGCTFRQGDNPGRVYTYHNDGPPVAVGDKVQIDSRDGLGKQVIFVAELWEDGRIPEFATKPILGLAPPPEGQLL